METQGSALCSCRASCSAFSFCAWGFSSEAENGAVHWWHTFWTAAGERLDYQFWQDRPDSHIYVWVEGFEGWRILPGFNPAPGNFAFTTDEQWIAEARQIKQQPTHCQSRTRML